MRVAVTGSIATDHLMTFPGRFVDSLLVQDLGRLSVSFLVDDLVVRRGGIAANICYGMGLLGEHPVLVGSVGNDFADYRSWLERHGVDTVSVHVSTLAHTARFLCTTDADHNQIASFYTGAMAEARDIELAPVAARLGGLDLVVVSPNDPDAMLRHSEECRASGIPFAADPSQQLARMEGVDIRALVEGASYLFTNEYESSLLAEKTGWTPDDLLERVGVWVTTLGPRGSRLTTRGEPPVTLPAAPEARKADPTGVGDAFRAGFVTGVAWGLALPRAAEVGSLVATYALETVGPQEYRFDHPGFLSRFAAAYGEEAASDLRPHLLAGAAGPRG
ncbi:MAG: carbohydrate kinase family protein [Acidimicrobiales bacterium]